VFVSHPSLGSVSVGHADETPKTKIVFGIEGMTLFITDGLEGNVEYIEEHWKGAASLSTVAR
jgi:hypothetical protein